MLTQNTTRTLFLIAAAVLFEQSTYAQPTTVTQGDRLNDTRPLELEGDLTSQLVEGVDRFLLRKIADSKEQRESLWQRDEGSAVAYEESIEPNRQRLRHMLGMRDARAEDVTIEIEIVDGNPIAAVHPDFNVHRVRWPAFRNVHGEGLLLEPKQAAKANVVAIPDADVTPEQLVGLVESAAGVDASSQFARKLAQSGCRVIIPTLVSRKQGDFVPQGGKKHDLTNREFLYRSAFVLGRHLVGYETNKILAAIDGLGASGDDSAPLLKTGIFGWGEGGMLALYAAALDPRIDVACVSGHFDSRQNIWQEPIDRNVFGLLTEFGDAELASMCAARRLIVEHAEAPAFELPKGTRGAPARIVTPTLESANREFQRAQRLAGKFADNIEVVGSADQAYGSDETLTLFLKRLGIENGDFESAKHTPKAKPQNPATRAQRQMRELDDHTQWALRESQFDRQRFMSRLKTDSLENYRDSVREYRDHFANEVIGTFDEKLLPMNPRSRRVFDNEKWTGYEVVLDVFPDVMAFGILLVPKDIKPGEKRPVVVCQHGLEGRPRNIIEKDHPAYHDFAAKLAERGFITFAPQNLYIFGDRFRTLQRKANCIKKTLFSVIVPQHQQIVNWLKTRPEVDPNRIAFYGLSYGGKSAMRIPPLVQDYCLSICSADFNEWVDKNASTRNPRSYVWSGEYEIFEFDLGGTFNYAEMAALIAPRPFMVERGHLDGVADDQTVAWEFAKVRNLYAARLKLPPEDCQIEWFDGPHTINGKGTFEFLHHHLDFAKP